MNKIHKYFISAPLYFISLLFPRNKRIWVFIGWHKTQSGEIFADNTKYLYLQMLQKNDVKAVWLAKSRSDTNKYKELGLKSAYYEHSLKGIWFSLRAGYTFIDAYIQRQNLQYVGRSKIVQLLHGKGLKKGGYGRPISKNNDIIFGPSKFALSLLPNSFTKNSKMIVTGYPRNDIFFKKIIGSEIGVSKETEILITNLKSNNEKIVFYTPTFRRDASFRDIKSIVDINKLNKSGLDNNITFFISLHPKLYKFNISEMDHVKFIPTCDFYPLLSLSDLLITDYSSIFVDYLLLNKPLIFFPHDLDKYQEKEGFSVDYNQHTPGPKVYSVKELCETIVKILNNPKLWEEERNLIKRKYHFYEDGESGERIYKVLTNLN